MDDLKTSITRAAMSDLHIDDFYKDTARILLQLYSYFPRKSTLYVEDISGPDTPDEFGLYSDRHQACFSAIIWLAEAHYIQYADTVRQEAVDQAVLTHKAFTLLSSRAVHTPADSPYKSTPPYKSDETENTLPSSVMEASRTNIAHIRQALKSGSSSTIGQIMHQLLLQSRHHQ